MNSQMATQNGLTALHGTIKREAQETISVAVDPLRDEMRYLPTEFSGLRWAVAARGTQFDE
eukprot:4417979-Pyramimonas_sp.AAC.1